MTSTRTLGSRDGERRRLSVRILDAIAEEEGISPLAFETPLFEVIDPDALDALFLHEGTDVTVEFTYRGYGVTVRGTDRVELTTHDG